MEAEGERRRESRRSKRTGLSPASRLPWRCCRPRPGRSPTPPRGTRPTGRTAAAPTAAAAGRRRPRQARCPTTTSRRRARTARRRPRPAPVTARPTALPSTSEAAVPSRAETVTTGRPAAGQHRAQGRGARCIQHRPIVHRRHRPRPGRHGTAEGAGTSARPGIERLPGSSGRLIPGPVGQGHLPVEVGVGEEADPAQPGTATAPWCWTPRPGPAR